MKFLGLNSLRYEDKDLRGIQMVLFFVCVFVCFLEEAFGKEEEGEYRK